MTTLFKSIFSILDLSEQEIESLSERADKLCQNDNQLVDQAIRNKEKHELLLVILAEWVSYAEELRNLYSHSVFYLVSNFNHLTHFEKGIFWHITGYLRGKKKDAEYLVIRSLNRSVDQLELSSHPNKDYYLSRVHNTLGQITYAKGKLSEAVLDYQNALRYKEIAKDEYGKALTFGNLGRLYFELGDFKLSREFLEKDLEILNNYFPELTNIRSIVLSNLGNAHIALQDYNAAKTSYETSLQIAISNEDGHSQIFPSLGIAKVLVHYGQAKEAKSLIEKAGYLIENLENTIEINTLSFFMYDVKAMISKATGNLMEAEQHYKKAKSCIPNSRISTIQAAKLLIDYSHLKDSLSHHDESEQLLKSALQNLDNTSAEEFRKELESKLKNKSRDQWLLHTFSRFTGIKNLEQLLDHSGLEGFSGKTFNIAILFIDIRGFTGIAEKMKADEVILLLNEFLERMIHLLQSYGGYIDKILGDALLAQFSLPEPMQDDCDRAAICALHMLEEVKKMNRLLVVKLPKIKVGIGIHFGDVVAGLIGSARKRSFTVIGDVVNTASRLEGMTKLLGTKIIVSKEFIDAMKNPDDFYLLALGRYIPLGRNTEIELFSLEGIKDESHDLKLMEELILLSDKALSAYYCKNFRKSIPIFRELYLQTGIEAFKILEESARDFQAEDPGINWDGSIKIKSK